MGILINQGAQPLTDDREIIVQDNVLMSITKIELGKKDTTKLVFTFKILDGVHSGRTVKDFVSYLPSDEFSWKYRNIRKSAGVPITENEPQQIDIEAVLLNRAVRANLKEYIGKDSIARQNIDYIIPPKPKTEDGKPTPTPSVSKANQAVELPDVETKQEGAVELPDVVEPKVEPKPEPTPVNPVVEDSLGTPDGTTAKANDLPVVEDDLPF